MCKGLGGIVSPFNNNFGFSMKTTADYDEKMLYPEELEFLSLKAVQKRRSEFCIGRSAAHSALSKIDINKFPILKGANNEPIWPPGIVGAISHSGEIALAAVARKENAAGIGLDVEMVDETVSMDIIKLICTIREAEWVVARKEQSLERLLMVFSAKESAFKAFFPLMNEYISYLEFELIWHEATRQFEGRLLTNIRAGYGEGYTFEVGCKKFAQYVYTFMSLPPV
ncbi:MAG: 4-phosphopantetheinyl transferase [Firmicutes bacterium]|nr:4-phosphopantetheinyl transferase [Bacillota bacterium]